MDRGVIFNSSLGCRKDRTCRNHNYTCLKPGGVRESRAFPLGSAARPLDQRQRPRCAPWVHFPAPVAGSAGCHGCLPAPASWRESQSQALESPAPGVASRFSTSAAKGLLSLPWKALPYTRPRPPSPLRSCQAPCLPLSCSGECSPSFTAQMNTIPWSSVQTFVLAPITLD